MKYILKTGAMALLAVCLLAAGCLPGMAENGGTITNSACSIVQSGDQYQVYCFAQVRNDSGRLICLDEGTLELMNGDMLLASQRVTQMWPYFLEPGEEGYLFDVVTFEPGLEGPVVPSVSGMTYDIEYMEINPQYAGEKLNMQARIESDDYSGKLSVICEISNPAQQPVFDPTVSFGLYTDAGQMLYAGGSTLYGVGVPAGGTVLARFDVDELFISQWISYGVTATQVRASAMVRSAQD